MIIADGQQFGEGWRPDLAAEAVPQIVAERGLNGAAFFLAPLTAPRPKHDLTVYMRQVWGEEWYLNQLECGSCVAHTGVLAWDIRTAINIVKSGSIQPAERADVMSVYWGSRNEIGGGRIRGQGSVNAWAAQWLKQYGAIPKRKYQSADLSKYDPSVCCGRQSSQGVPDDLEPIARENQIDGFDQVKTFDEAVYAIDNEMPVMIASDQGFSMQLDADGFGTPLLPITPRNAWLHSQVAAAYELTPKRCLWLVNHWGLCYRGGPAGWCRAIMKVSEPIANYMLSSGDCWAVRGGGYKPNRLDFSSLNF